MNEKYYEAYNKMLKAVTEAVRAAEASAMINMPEMQVAAEAIAAYSTIYKQQHADFFAKYQVQMGLLQYEAHAALMAAQPPPISILKDFTSFRTPWFVYQNWYLSYRIWEDWEIKDIVECQDIEKGELRIIETFLRQKDEIKMEILSHFSQRSEIINEIFDCFENKSYYAAIVLAYSQLDGMCKEKTQNQFWSFDKNENRPSIEALINEKKNTSLSFINPQIRNRIETNQSLKYFENLEADNCNRHAVLHGYTYKFGNEKNAIRAILYMDFFVSYLEELKNASTAMSVS